VKLESRINYIAFLVIGFIFILVGVALNELDPIEVANKWSDNNLDMWHDFLKPWIGDENNGLPEPWQP
jgi:hypothetical protein